MGCGCTLHIVDTDEHTMDLLLEWVYGGLETTPSLPETKALFQAAHKYDLVADLVADHTCAQLERGL
ncbi:hypothetical protein ABBQ38_004782 [Trebouxia sp. C0009 RCD-2024]